MSTESMPSTYNHKDYEDKWYKHWEKSGVNKSVPDDREPYTILMPPPNVTSQLHMGHGTGYSFQDLLIRWKRMSGYNTCWLPGTDHAGIATQMMVEKSLEEKGQTRIEIGREAFLAECESWQKNYGGIILDQFRKLGFSCNWDRVAYTMDDHLSKAVRHVFVEMFTEGLIYRGERLVNWDTQLRTAISDDEVENKEVAGSLWYFKYPIDGSSEFIPFATTRPETMLGDTAVAVNPEDERFSHLIGKSVVLPICGRKVPIISDEYVKSEFGTGVVKITPAHDPNDFEIGKRHNLPMINIMNEDGTLNDFCPEEYRGIDRFEARKIIIKKMKEKELYDKTEPHKNSIPHSERSKTIIEPRLSHQWFVNMKDLSKPAADAARDGTIKFYPDAWKKTYLNWLDNIQDWCISRQLWWGHQIPVWQCSDCQEYTTGMEDPTACSKCASKNISQDEDVLDTWFSSWLWPLSPFGWPDAEEEKNRGLSYYYPSDVLVTGPDIINLWVSRMIVAGLKFRGEVPFKDIYFNATVCDKKGRKFSKTLGNGIDPLNVINNHGADAVRYTAVSLAPLGGRIKMSESDFDAGARFVNKIWNATRFILQGYDETIALQKISDLKLRPEDKWIINQLHVTAKNVDIKFNGYRLNDAVEDIYHLIWSNYCDWAIEAAKDRLQSSDPAVKQGAYSVLFFVLDGIFRLIHPVMPFVSEELWQRIPGHPDWDRPETISFAKYPVPEDLPSFEEESKSWQKVQNIITGIRSLRSQVGIPPKEKVSVFVKASEGVKALIDSSRNEIERLAKVATIDFVNQDNTPSKSLVSVGRGFEIFLPVEGRFDVDAEVNRLQVELKKIEGVIRANNGKLSNKNFVDRAPPEVVAETKQKTAEFEKLRDSYQQNIKSLN